MLTPRIIRCDTHVSPPLLRRGKDVNRVHDKHGDPLSFYPDVPAILLQCHRDEIHLAAASRTHAPKVARQILAELHIPGRHRSDRLEPARNGVKENPELISAVRLFDSLEIYPGSKITHFQELHKKTGIAYEDMVCHDIVCPRRGFTDTYLLHTTGLLRRSACNLSFAYTRAQLCDCR